MTADIRTAAQRAAEAEYPKRDHADYETREAGMLKRLAFRRGYLAGAARVTPTREQVERALIGRDFITGADAILALMEKLAAGE